MLPKQSLGIKIDAKMQRYTHTHTKPQTHYMQGTFQIWVLTLNCFYSSRIKEEGSLIPGKNVVSAEITRFVKLLVSLNVK